MPFTASHAAAVLPFVGTGLPASALVIGSMAPDLPYFVPLRIGSVYPPHTVGGPTHAVWALVSLDLLIGAAAWLIWHLLLAAPLLAMSPHPLRARLTGRVEVGVARRLARPQDAAGVLLALVVGAGSHVLWDEFTHQGRWGTAHVPILAATWGGRPGYSWAQGVSDLVCAAVLAVWWRGWWRRTTPQAVPRSRVPRLLWAVVLGSGVGAGLASAVELGPVAGMPFVAVTRGLAVVLATVVAASLLWHVLTPDRRPVSP